MNGRYEDIMELPRPVFNTRPRMDMVARGAQFAPFAALQGFDEEIKKRTEEEYGKDV